MRRVLATALALAAVGGPARAVALEPRFDHRDTQGLVLEPRLVRDTVAVAGEPSATTWRPALRIGYGFDALGEGDDLLIDVETSVRSFDDPSREHVLLSADVRYRAYVGTEELKTFLEFGIWLPIRSRLAVGPLVGVGLAYDFSRWFGIFAAGGFATGFGQARVTSFSVAAGCHLRFPI